MLFLLTRCLKECGLQDFQAQVYLKNLVDAEFNIVGVIDDNSDRKFFEQDIPFINHQDAQKIILEFDVSEVLLLIPSLTARELDSIITKLKSFDVIIKMLPLSHERGVQVQDQPRRFRD